MVGSRTVPGADRISYFSPVSLEREVVRPVVGKPWPGARMVGQFF